MILGIYGSSGLGREVLDLVREINKMAGAWNRIVFIDDYKMGVSINNTKVITYDEFKTLFSVVNAKVVIALGEPKIRGLLREKVSEGGYGLQSIIHPTALVGTETKIGNGAIVQYGCFISCNVIIGDNVLLQPSSNVGHDSVIGQDTVISSFVAISGTCKIGERAYIGVSVPVKENTSIGSDSIIGMGSVVLRDIPDNVIALGNPARPMKANETGHVFK